MTYDGEQEGQIDIRTLSAYLDDELDAEERHQIEQLLRQSPDAQARLEAYRLQEETLRTELSGVLEEAVPDRLLETVDESKPDSAARETVVGRPWRRFFSVAAAASVGLVVSAVAGWVTHGIVVERQAEQLALQMFLHEAVSSYSILAREDSPWAGSGLEESLGSFGERLKSERELDIFVPDLEEEGFSFVGARELPAARGHSGQLIYEGEDKGRVVLHFTYVDSPGRHGVSRATSGPRGADGSYVEQDDVPIYYWSSGSGSASYALLGGLDKEQITSLGETLLGQFE
ncbi:anti-sigma factor RsiW [Natronospira proteinivora]|uniref:Anti-sigma factor RsiW n=1 Tax=Natronospira proteinivora TaxID=1807133 RepID=A0ABT1G846_9GAMM|nr:hypothetical protein [Natronospira proteinivora]MCP1727227.1 anti-sigma factor RsiW [Natronospira proteinivora]